MANYSNTFGGASKDASNDTILGAEYDTQYDSIASMSTTKADKIGSATANNIMTMDGTGNPTDGGVTIDQLKGLIYPVGALFMSKSATNPSVILGIGTWAQIEGRFILGESGDYAVGSVGGSADAVVISHEHNIDHDHPITDTSSDGAHIHALDVVHTGSEAASGADYIGGSENLLQGSMDTETAVSHTHTLDLPEYVGVSSTEGVDGTGLNLPPYEVAFIWERTA